MVENVRSRIVGSNRMGGRWTDGFESAVSRAHGVAQTLGRDGFVDVVIDRITIDHRADVGIAKA